jgi:hypothetical protein
MGENLWVVLRVPVLLCHTWDWPSSFGVWWPWVLQPPPQAAPQFSACFQEVSARPAEPPRAASHARDRGVPAALVCRQ